MSEIKEIQGIDLDLWPWNDISCEFLLESKQTLPIYEIQLKNITNVQLNRDNNFYSVSEIKKFQHLTLTFDLQMTFTVINHSFSVKYNKVACIYTLHAQIYLYHARFQKLYCAKW